MKKLLSSLMSAGLLCSFTPWKTIEGNGNLKTETRELKGFTGISMNGNMNLDLSYGQSNTISIEADDNLLPYIETTLKDGMLVVKAKEDANLKSKNNLTVHVSMIRLTDLKLSGSGNVKGNGGFSNDGTTTISLSGSGNVSLSAKSFGQTNVAISGSGNISLKGGTTENLEARISGSGNIDCSDFVSTKATARISGSGNVEVNASKSIEANISGSGNVYYKGEATDVKSKALGSGKVIKM